MGTELQPGAVVIIQGQQLSSQTTRSPSERLERGLGQVRVTINGRIAPLQFISPRRIAAQIPWELLGSAEAEWRVENNGVSSEPFRTRLRALAPKLLTARRGPSGQGLIIIDANARPLAARKPTTRSSAPARARSRFPREIAGIRPPAESRPARPGEAVEIYTYRAGIPVERPVTGNPASESAPGRLLISPLVMIGSVPAIVEEATLAPGSYGLFRIRVRIPSNAPTGDTVSVTMDAGLGESEKVFMAIEPRDDGRAIELSTAQTLIEVGEAFRFSAQTVGLSGTELEWSADSPLGNSFYVSEGSLRAPSNLPPDPFVVVRVSASENAGIFATALVRFRDSDEGAQLSIDPPMVVVPLRSEVQFRALLDGNPADVSWFPSSNLDSSGRYQSVWSDSNPMTWVTARSRGASAVAIVYHVPSLPKVSRVMIDRASQDGYLLAGEKGFINGEGLVVRDHTEGASARVFFPFAGGGHVAATASGHEGEGRLTVEVPFGAVSGYGFVEVTPAGAFGQTVWTDPFELKVYGRPLIRPARNDVGAGESVQLRVRFLGNRQPVALTWKAERGLVTEDGVYTAPAPVLGDFHTRVEACIKDTDVCGTAVLRVVAFEIEPDAPILEAGQTQPFSTVFNGTRGPGSWEVLTKNGEVDANGVLISSDQPGDAGELQLRAHIRHIFADARVPVVGDFPGVVNRISYYPDYRFTRFRQWIENATRASGLAVCGDRLYVGARSVSVVSNFGSSGESMGK